MIRKLALSTALLLMVPGIAGALGLSNIELRSALNEPLDARIELLGATADQLENLQVSLGSSEDFQRAGLIRPFVLVSLRFKLIQAEGSTAYIMVSSPSSITEPFLNFLLKAEWDSGRILREYTVLLDPPLYNPYKSLSAEKPSAPVAQAAAPQVGGTDVQISHEVHYAGKAPSATSVRSAYAPSAGSNVVGEAETLWSIARRLRPDDSVTIQQMMLALFNNNPDAFINGNMNLLKRGSVLEVPDLSPQQAASTSEAVAEINRHHELWEEYRQNSASGASMQAMGSSSSAGTGDSPQAAPKMETTDGRLELVSQAEAAAGDAGMTGSGGSTSGDSFSSGQELDLVNEQLEAARMENADLQQRLVKEEELVGLLQRQIELKDNQLAAMQARAAEAGLSEELPEPIADETAPVMTEPVIEAGSEQQDDASPVVQEEETPAVLAEPIEPVEEPVVVTEEATAETEKAEIDLAVATTDTAAPVAEEVLTEVVMPTPEVGILDQAKDILTLIIPESVIESLPGGVITALAVVLLIPLLLIGLLLKRRKSDDDSEELAPLVVETAESEAVTQFAPDEDITDINESEQKAEDSEPVEAEFDDESPTQINVPVADSELDNTVTLAAAIQAAPEEEEPESDPLEEVNVYLAYEQFDQAEALVKKVIADKPDEVSYKLRLLEVYYSSNNKAAYEVIAREVFEATGGEGEEWGNTVAMWEAMSPDRALFAEGGEAVDSSGQEDSKNEFVDLTSDEGDEQDGIIDLGEDTVNMVPGGTASSDNDLDFDLESTNDFAGEDDVLDLTAMESPEEQDDVLDLTAVESADDEQDEMLDLTAVEDVDESDDVLDLTAADDEELLDIPDDGMLELDSGEDESVELLDLTSAEEDSEADSDLLDITSTGDISNLSGDVLGSSGADNDDLLDVTSMGEADEVDDSDMMDLSDTTELSAADEHVMEFDIGASDDADDASDESLSMDLELDKSEADEEGMLDLTSADSGDDELQDLSLAADDSDAADEGMLDLTSADSGEDELLDLSLAADDSDSDTDDEGMLDLTAADSGEDELLDLSLSEDDSDADDEGMLDLTSADSGEDELLDLSLDANDSDADDEGMLDLTSADSGDDELLDLSLSADDSDADDEGMLDLTAAGSDDDEMLDLSLDAIGSDSEMDGMLDLTAADSDDDEVLDLSLDAVEFDEDESESDTNDIFLDTHGNDTVEMPAVNVESMSVADVDSSLDDLAQSLDAIELEVGESLSEAKQQDEGDDFDFSLDIDEDADPLATMELDVSSLSMDDDEEDEGIDKTVVMPRSANIEQQTEVEEIDNKLNLARAYIELGDKDGARSILDEVVEEGEADQKREAESLLQQLN